MSQDTKDINVQDGNLNGREQAITENIMEQSSNIKINAAQACNSEP